MHVTLPGLRRFLPALALMLAVSMTPGAPELVENAVHLLGHGDTAHAEASHSSNSSHSSDSSHSSSSKDADEDRDPPRAKAMSTDAPARITRAGAMHLHILPTTQQR